jgi:OHCU decarboxylase
MRLAETTQSNLEPLQHEPMPLTQLNGLDQRAFVRLIGPVFEHSPWIAEAAWSRCRFQDLANLHTELCRVVREASMDEKLALIRAHPDLAGRAALQGSLTPESSVEQASAGLNRLSAGELLLFRQRNDAYRARFGFPFVICARLNDKKTILSELGRRLENTHESELEAALAEIFKIAELRLRNLVRE